MNRAPGVVGRFTISTVATLLFIAVGVFAATGCGGEEEHPDFVARVEDQYLTREELENALHSMPGRLDSAEARQQIIDQWVTNALLYDEATRRGLRNTDEVRRLLEENERSVLASALLSRLYEEEGADPTPAEIQSYFERNRELFRIREPFIRIRHLAHANPDTAQAARRAMIDLVRSNNPDSVWQHVASRFADDPTAALNLSATHLPESHLFANQPELRQAMRSLRPGETSPVIAQDNLHHVLQVVEVAPAGSIPEIEWVEAELRRRLEVQSRKQIYANQVQRLRNEALSREELEIR